MRAAVRCNGKGRGSIAGGWWRAPGATLALLVVAATSGFAAEWRDVSITVPATGNTSLRNQPLQVALPIAPGALRSDAAIALQRAGRVLPTQVEVLARWSDGSPRWLRLDSVLARPSSRPTELRAVRGRPPAPETPLVVRETKDAVEINTGAIHFRVPKNHFAVAEAVGQRRRRKADIASVTASMVVDGRVHTAGAPDSVAIVQRGAVRGALEMRGPFGPDFAYLCRLEYYSGSPLLRVWFTYVKRNGRAVSAVERLAVDLRFAEEIEGQWYSGLDRGKPLRGTTSSSGVSLVQPDNLVFAVDGDVRDGHLAGWAEVSDKRRAIGVASRWFWQEYAKALTVSSQGITYDLWAPQGGTVNVGMGSAKTHELVIWAAPRGAIGKASSPLVARPLHGWVDPVRAAASGALRGAIDPSKTEFDEALLVAAHRVRKRNAREVWDDCGRERCDRGTPERKRKGAFGMLNWGDWNFPGYRDTVKGTDAWGNLEYDTTQVLALTYAATGDAAVFDAMVAAARHFMDVDTVHALPKRSEWIGMNHPKNPLHFSFALGGIDVGHTWTEGLVSYYLLTGDRRGLEVARGIADYLVRRSSAVLRGNPRQWGWPVIALLGVYDVDRHPRFIEAAKRYAVAGMRAHEPKANPRWKLGILADAVALLDSYDPNPEARAWLDRYAGAVASARSRDSRLYPAVAYAGMLRRNAAWQSAARRRLAGIDLGSWGKPFTIGGRVGLRIESLLARQPDDATTSPLR